MSRNLALISGNETVLKETRKVFDRFNVAVTYLSNAQEIFQHERKYDLLLLDGSSTESGPRFLQRLQSDDRFSNIFGFIPSDMTRDRFFWQRILSMLYQRVTGEQKRWPGTEVVWKLMEARVASIVVGELLKLLSEMDLSALASNEAYEPSQISAQLDKSLFSLIDEDSFLSVLAERLFSELPGLLWVEITESLVDRNRCEIECIGNFEKYYEWQGAKVSFGAEKELSQLTVPALEFSRHAFDEVSEKALRLCAPNIVYSLYELATIEPWEARLGVLFLEHALRSICLQMKASKEEEPSPWMDWITGNPQNLKGWFGVLSKASAYAAYYVLIMSLGRAIQKSKRVEIPAVGTFIADGTRIAFEASPELTSLIDANPSALTAGGTR